jgi:hypothetical protein
MTQPGPPRPRPPHPPQNSVTGLALAGLIVGICAFAVGFIPIVGVIIGIIACALGIVALHKRQHKVLALTGAILGGLAILASLAVTIGIATYVNGLAERSETAVAESQAERAEQDAWDESLAPQDTAPADESAADPNAAAVSAEYAAALEVADIYANRMDMSKAGIYDQLTSASGEGMTPESAQYAVDTVEADWEANALATAKVYRDELALSHIEIREQLATEYGGQFTPDEVDYAMEHLDD